MLNQISSWHDMLVFNFIYDGWLRSRPLRSSCLGLGISLVAALRSKNVCNNMGAVARVTLVLNEESEKVNINELAIHLSSVLLLLRPVLGLSSLDELLTSHLYYLSNSKRPA